MSDQTQSTEQHQPHLLVVDDEPEILQLISLCFNNSCRVTCADNVADACRLLVVEPFDVIITDVMMPGEDGIAFLGRVHESWPELPVILMTGHAQLQMTVSAIKNGAFDFVHKPFDLEYLRKIVMRAVNYRNLQKMEKDYRVELEATVARRSAELKESMAELCFVRGELQQAATDKSSFMSTISHEMRTPMNCVIGSLDLLAVEGLTGLSAEYLAMARQSAENMVELINQLLSFNTRYVQGGDGSRRDLVDLRSLLQSIIVAQQPLFTRKGISLSLKISDDVPCLIWTGREKFCRLFEILLGNALKFTDHGGVTLECSSDRNDTLLCTVTDSGIGIPEGMLERIFEPFVQGDSSLTRRHDGIGLGLSIARQNTMLLDGNVFAEHVPVGGSRFTVTLKIITP